MRAVLQATKEAGGLAETEEHLGEWTRKTLGPYKCVAVETEYEPLGDRLDLSFAERSPDIPKMELHLGFDLPKDSGPRAPTSFPT